MNNIKLEVTEGMALVTIDRPKALNALNSETLEELNGCLKGLEQRKDVRVVVLTGGGAKSFVAGADIAEMVGFLDVAHFSRVFKKLTGVSAGEYRNHL